MVNTRSIDNLDEEVECSPSKFAASTKLRGAPDAPEGQTAIQRDLTMLEKWLNRNLMKFRKLRLEILI